MRQTDDGHVLNKDDMEFFCRCTPKRYEGMSEYPVSSWISTLVKGTFKTPTTPCPDCDKTDDVRKVSSGWERA